MPFVRALFDFGALNLIILGSTLIIFGVLFAVIRLARLNARAGFFSVLIALVGAASFCIASGTAALSGTFDVRLIVLPIAVGLTATVFGWLFTLRERKFPEFRAKSSFGLLFIGVGLFIVFATLYVPVIPTQFVLPTPTRFITNTPTPSRTLPATRTPAVSFTYTSVPSLTPSPTPISSLTPAPSLTALPTLPQRPTATPTRNPSISPTAVPPTVTVTALPRACRVQIAAGVNLRAEARPDARVIEVNAVAINLPVLQQSADKAWFAVQLEDGIVWVAASVVVESGDCDQLSTVTPTPS